MSGAEEIPSVKRHRAAAPASVGCAVITVSDTRTLETDSGGALVAELLEGGGHRVLARRIVPDDAARIREALGGALGEPDCQAVLLTGGTGVAARDVTPEAVRPLLDRELPGFGELFRMLSYEEIGAAALVSRALAGLRGQQLVFALPGSRGAIRLALEKLILPELGHLVGEGQAGTHQD
jgi:molybdenum cofactor biosynthesis protein B